MTMLQSAPTAEVAGAAPPTREYRAMWTFAIAAAWILFFGLLVLGAAGPSGDLASFGIVVIGLSFVVNAVAAWGLSKNRDWARAAMTPMLWIFVGSGVLLFLVSLTRSSLNVPIGGILAAWALTAAPSRAMAPPASSTQAALLIGGALLAALLQFL